LAHIKTLFAQQAVIQAQKKLKMNNPTPFKGERSKLRVFLAQMQLYFSVNAY
jgi:hypothetical protein